MSSRPVILDVIKTLFEDIPVSVLIRSPRTPDRTADLKWVMPFPRFVLPFLSSFCLIFSLLSTTWKSSLATHLRPLFAGKFLSPFAASPEPPCTGDRRRRSREITSPFAAKMVPPPAASPDPPRAEVHVPLGVLVIYEGMTWSPEPAPRQRPPVPAPRQRPPVPAPRKLLPNSFLCLRWSRPAPRCQSAPESLRCQSAPESPRCQSAAEGPRFQSAPEGPRF